MKESRAESADTDREEHVAQLRNGGIGENFFNVVLRKTHRRREKRGRRADHRHHAHGVWRE